jgi:hypothetical protein
MSAQPDIVERQSYIYLLRLWRENAGAPWRASIRRADSDAAVGFASLNELVSYLTHEMQGDIPAQVHLLPEER